MEKIANLASKNEILIFSNSTCCLCYAVHILFQELGLQTFVHEVDLHPKGNEMEGTLMRMGCSGPLPAIFTGGEIIRSTNEVISLHLRGSLIPGLLPHHS